MSQRDTELPNNFENCKSHFASSWHQKLKPSFSSEWQTALGLIFVENKDWTKGKNRIVFFFKKKITLKHLKTVRYPDPRVRL